MELTGFLRSAGQGALGDLWRSMSPGRGLQVCTTKSGPSAWKLGSEVQFLCLCDDIEFILFKILSYFQLFCDKLSLKIPCIYPCLAGLHVIPLFKHISIFQTCLCPHKTNKYLAAIVFGRLRMAVSIKIHSMVWCLQHNNGSVEFSCIRSA